MNGRSAALVAALLASVSSAHADEQSEALIRQFLETIDASPAWSASAGVIRSDGSDTIAEALVFSRGEPAYSVTFDMLRLADLESADNGGFYLSELELTGGSIISESSEATIATATGSDITLPDLGGLAFDPARPMTFVGQLYSALADAEVEELHVPEIHLLQQQPAPDGQGTVNAETSYRDLRFEDLSGGVLALTEMGPITTSVDSPESEMSFRIESVAVERTDIGALGRVFDESQYRDGVGDGIWRPAVSRIDYGGVIGTGEEGVSFRVDAFSLDNIDARQPEKPFVRGFDILIDPNTPEGQKEEIGLETLQSFASAFRLGAARMQGLSVEPPAEAGSFSLGEMNLLGLSNEGIDSFAFRDLQARSPEFILDLASFEFAGLVFPDLEALIRIAEVGPEVPPEQREQALRDSFAAMPKLSHFGMAGLSAGMSEDLLVTLGSFTMDFDAYRGSFPTETDIRMKELAVPGELLRQDPQVTEILDSLGYDDMVFGMSFSDRWSPDSGIDSGSIGVSVQDAGEMVLSYDLTGVTENWLIEAIDGAAAAEDSEAATMLLLGDLGLRSASLRITDDSMLDRGFGLAAQKQGLSVTGEAYRQQMRGALPFLLSAAVPAELSKLLSAPLQVFLGGGQTLVAEIAPDQAIPLLELIGASTANPMGLPELLNLTVSTEEAPAE